jgi:transposase-like protein
MERARAVRAVEWAERIAAAQASGKSMADVAREHGVSLQSVHKWARRLRKQAENKVPRGFAKVERAPKKSSRGLTIEIGNARIGVESVADIPLATALLRALGIAR